MKLTYSGSGIILFDPKEYNCDLYLNEDRGGIQINISVKKALGDFLEFPFKKDFLSGELSTGFKFLLINCSRLGMKDLISEGRSVFSYTAQYMVKGVGGKDCKEIKFHKMEFGLLDIMEWGGVSGYKVGENQELLYNEKEKKDIYKCEQFTVKYCVTNSLLPLSDYELLKEKITLRQYGSIEIELNEEKPIDKFIAIITKAKRLIELSTLRHIYMISIKGWSSNIQDNYGKEQYERDIEIIGIGLRKDEDYSEDNRERWRWINLPELIENDSFEHYFSKYEILKPVIEQVWILSCLVCPQMS